MDSSGEFYYIFLTQKQRSNVLLPTTKANIIAWWVSKTIISPNKKQVSRKLIILHVSNEKPTQFLMES
jgi:hypothetical protein